MATNLEFTGDTIARVGVDSLAWVYRVMWAVALIGAGTLWTLGEDAFHTVMTALFMGLMVVGIALILMSLTGALLSIIGRKQSIEKLRVNSGSNIGIN